MKDVKFGNETNVSKFKVADNRGEEQVPNHRKCRLSKPKFI